MDQVLDLEHWEFMDLMKSHDMKQEDMDLLKTIRRKGKNRVSEKFTGKKNYRYVLLWYSSSKLTDCINQCLSILHTQPHTFQIVLYFIFVFLAGISTQVQPTEEEIC